jgi:hypothetical protein|tara:strand:- start:4941 stop:5174 length:234 start_codon:yes stop_codon:yes gene_type:complete
MDVFCVHKIRRSLGFVETICQAVSLLFALQNKEGRRRMMDLAEDNPRPVILSGVVAMIIFFTICFFASTIVLRMSMA